MAWSGSSPARAPVSGAGVCATHRFQLAAVAPADNAQSSPYPLPALAPAPGSLHYGDDVHMAPRRACGLESRIRRLGESYQPINSLLFSRWVVPDLIILLGILEQNGDSVSIIQYINTVNNSRYLCLSISQKIWLSLTKI